MRNEVLKKIMRYKFNISVALVSFALFFYFIEPFKVIDIELLKEIIGIEPFNLEKLIMFQLSLMLLIIIIIVTCMFFAGIFIGRLQLKKEVENLTLFKKQQELKRQDEQKKEEEIEKMKKVFFYLCDGVHNIGSEMYGIENEEKAKEQMKIIGEFFSLTRTGATSIDKIVANEEDYVELLEFIKNDFHDYCHNQKKDIDLKRYCKLLKI